MKVLRNGQLVDNTEAVISVFDHGFLYGMGLFETFRTYRGRPWLIDRHAARLADGCRELGIAYEPDAGQMAKGVSRLLEANGLEDAYIRWSVTAGEGALGMPSAAYETPAEIVYAKPLAPDDPDSRPGRTLRLLRLHRSSPEGRLRLKSFHYMNNILAKRELAAAGAAGGTEGLFVDGSGHVCEAIVSNVFWLSGGILYTPSSDSGALPGITRQYLIEIASESGYTVQQGLYSWDDIAAADEVFLTNSIQEIVPVAMLEDADGHLVRKFDSGGGGSAVRSWMRTYRSDAEGGERDQTDILPSIL